jgi:transcriptional regulator
MGNRQEWTDGQILAALQLRDWGWTREQIGARLGRTKNSVVGVINRVDRELAASEYQEAAE